MRRRTHTRAGVMTAVACVAALTAAFASPMTAAAETMPATSATATSSVIALRSAPLPLGSDGSRSLVFTNGAGKGIVVGNNVDGRVAVIGNDGSGVKSWSVDFPRKTGVGTYLFDPNSNSPSSWLADTRCSTGPNTAKAVVHDAVWTSAGVPTRLSISLTFPCATILVDGPGTTSVEVRYQEPIALGVGETTGSSAGASMTVGTPTTTSSTFTNIGTGVAVMGSAFVGGESNPIYPSFFIKSDGCKGKTLVPNATCQIVLTFDAPVHSNPTGVLFVPDGRPQPSVAWLSGSAASQPDQPEFVRVAGSLGSAVVSFFTPAVSTTGKAYDGFEVLPRAADGTLGAVVATSGPSPESSYSGERRVAISALADRKAISYVVRAIMPGGGSRGPVSWYATDSTVGRLLIAAGDHGISLRGLDPVGHVYSRTGEQATIRRIVASPDRSTVAFGTLFWGSSSYSCSMWVMPLTGLSPPSRLNSSTPEGCDDFPTFTSNTSLVFSHAADGNQPSASTPSLQSYDLTTGTVSQVVGGQGLTMPSAAPDGTIVATDPVAQTLVRITPGVVTTPTVIPNTSAASNPSVDPVTGRIAFIQKIADYHERVAVVNADGSSPVQLTPGNNIDTSPAWDGNRVYFSEDREIWFGTLPTSTLTKLITGDTETRSAPLVLDVPDTTPPAVRTSTLPPFSNAVTVPVTVTATDPGPAGSGVATYDAQRAPSSVGPWTTPTGWSGSTSSTFPLGVATAQTSCFRARASDAAGNTSNWTAPTCVTGDTTMPVLTSLTVPAVYASNGRLTVKPAYGDSGSGIASITYRYHRAAVNSTAFGGFINGRLTTATFATAMSAGYEYCVAFSAADKVGNTSAWSRERCAIAALEDRSLTMSSASTRITSSAFHAANATQLKASGAQLTLASVSGRQVGVLVRTCSTCGTLDLYVGSTHLGRISTRSSTTRNQVLLWLPRQSVTRTGKLIVRQLDSHGVYVDAIVVQHL